MAHLGAVSFNTTDGLSVEVFQYPRYSTYVIKDAKGQVFKATAHPNMVGISWYYDTVLEDGFSAIDAKTIAKQHIGIDRFRKPITSINDAEPEILQAVRKVAITLPKETTTLNEIENCINAIKYSDDPLQILTYITTMQEYTNLLRDLWVLKAADAINKLNEARKTVANS